MYIDKTYRPDRIQLAAIQLATMAYHQFPDDFQHRTLQQHIDTVIADCREGDYALLVFHDDDSLLGGCIVAEDREVHQCPRPCALVLLSYCAPGYGAGLYLYRHFIRSASATFHEFVGWSHRVGLWQYAITYKRTQYGNVQLRRQQGSRGST